MTKGLLLNEEKVTTHFARGNDRIIKIQVECGTAKGQFGGESVPFHEKKYSISLT
jgi:hypothetical protein